MQTKRGLTSCRRLFPRGPGRPFVTIQILLASALLLLLAAPARAQLYSGSVTGVVTDPSGAVIPGAKVALKDVTKGYTFTASSDAVGRYILRNIPPSTYTLSVEATGFKSYTRTGIVLDVNQNATANVSLELGTTTQTVQVSGAPPLLATQDATTGQNVNRTYINDLPLLGRGVFDLAFLSPGVNPSPGNAFGNSQTMGTANNFTSNGGRNATSDILIDGVSTTDYEQNSAIIVPLYTPSVDAVQEFKVQQNNFSAEIGFSGNTVLNVVMRSGTNQLHGSAYEFLRNQALDANNWFNNRAGIDLPARRYNQFGGTVGGPIVLPHLYNGKNKTFFFFDYQATRDHSAQSFRAGVPSAAERAGNFSELCAYGGGTFDSSGACSDSNAQLWDPYSGVYDAANGGPDRSAMVPFNNMATYQSAGAPALAGTPYQIPAVPGNIIDPVSQKMLSYYPMPNVGTPAEVDPLGNVITPASSGYDPYNNWAGAGVNIGNGDQFDIKIDQRFSSSNLLSARYSQGWGNYHGPSCFKNALDPCTQGPGNDSQHAFVLNDTWTLNPSTVLSLGYGFTRAFTYTHGVGADFPNFDPVSSLGLPSYMSASGFPASPSVYIYGGYQFAAGESLGAQAWSIMKYGQETHDLLGSLDKIVGRHEIKVGGEFRVHRVNFGQPGAPGGIMTFDVNTTSQYPWWGGGDAMASFLTGIGGPGQWGEYEVPLFVSTQNMQYGSFVQDNWRATDKLTVNLGLRYDIDLPRTERHNRMEWFDPSAKLPFTVPGMNVAGGEVFAGVNGNPRTVVNSYYKSFAPRVGLAYRFWKNTVFRAGYGIYYNPSAWGAAGTGPGGYDGFTGVSSWPNTYNNDGATPFYFMRNPFPYGITMPTGSSLGVLQQMGLGVTGPVRAENSPSYTQTWSAGIQHELPGGVLFGLNYVGTKGTHLYFNGAGDINHLGPSIENASLAQIAALQTYVPNPMYGLITDPTSSLSGTEVPAYQLDRPFPQFTGVSVLFPPEGNSIYHALQLRVQKNMSHGLQFVGNYTWSKTISDSDVSSYTTWLGGFTGIQDPNNLKLERSVSQYSIPQVFTFGYVYSLPFGRGKQFGSKWNPVVNAFLGGWKTSGLWRFDTGQPVAINLSGGGTPLPTYGGQRPDLTAPLQRNTGSNWRTQYFTNPQAIQVPAHYAIGTAPRTLPNVYMPGAKTAGLSLLKEFPLGVIHEGMRLEYRLETFNAFNHPQFGCLNGTVQTNFVASDLTTYSGFGQLNCQANSPREVQMALKIYF